MCGEISRTVRYSFDIKVDSDTMSSAAPAVEQSAEVLRKNGTKCLCNTSAAHPIANVIPLPP